MTMRTLDTAGTQDRYRFSYQRLKRLERNVLVPECYTSRKAYLAESLEERMTYVEWLEGQQTSPCA